MHAEHPELVKDAFWDEGVPEELPYTLAAEESRQTEPWQGSAAEVIPNNDVDYHFFQESSVPKNAFIQVEVSEQQGEFVYLETIEEEPGSKGADQETGDIIDNPEAGGSGRRQSVVTDTSSVSGPRPGTEGMAGPLMNQVWRALHRQMSGGSGRRPRRKRRSPRGGTPRSSSGQGMTLLSHSSSLRSHRSESSTKSGNDLTQVQEAGAIVDNTDEMVKPPSANTDPKDAFSSKL